ncbi:MAG: DNA polymerase IV [Haliscomenobacter sp.]|nr:DNA polymerase IV [Haliscomenobacter sp.]MBP9076307.1 DNA polymerase IV [Haliscomenobacter sp.]MBP9873574.1 DNA polymerase IV [Haliscomenobacter sp.]
MFDRAILHLDLDAFFASVESLRNPSLKGKPLIVGGYSGRGVVASCSYEARRFGVRSAMPVRTALRLCPDAIVVRGDMEAYSRYSKMVTEIIAEQAPLFEKASIDEFYADLSGMDRYFGCWRWAVELRQRILRESGLPISMALAVNKLVAKIGAGEAKPNGEQLIEAGAEREYIAPLPVQKLPAVGEATARKLNLMGVRTIETLRRIPPRLLEREFGQHGTLLWKRANAEDDSPVVPYHDQKSVSTERTFQQDTADMGWLRDQLTSMVMELGYELRQKQQLTSCITLKLRYADFNTFTRQRAIPYTVSDQFLMGVAHDLFAQLYERRQRIRLLGVRFSGLTHGRPQLNLFDNTPEDARLLGALDKIRTRFGSGAITRACTMHTQRTKEPASKDGSLPPA